MGAFQDKVIEFERLHGPMSDEEMQTFFNKWKKTHAPAVPKQQHVPGGTPLAEKISGVGDIRPVLRDLKSAGSSLVDRMRQRAPDKEARDEEKTTSIKDWMNKARLHLGGDTDAQRENQELGMGRALESIPRTLNHLLTGAPTQENLRPEYGGPDDEEFTETIDMPPPGTKGNPIHLGPVSLPEELRTSEVTIDVPRRAPEMRTEEVVINVPRRR